MKKSIRIEFDQNWIFEHRGDDVLPVDKAVEILKNEFRNAQVESSGFTDIDMIVETDDPTDSRFSVDYIRGTIMRVLPVTVSDIITVLITDIAAEKKEEPVPVAEPEQPAESPAESKPADSKPADSGSAFAEFSLSQKSSEKSVDADSVTNKIKELVGCEEFKKIVDEIVLIAPEIKSHKTFTTFLFQNYLFSINDGYGLSTYLESFADVIDALGLFEFKSKEKVTEIKVSASDKPGGMKAALDEALEKVSGGFTSGGKLVCFDISEQMSKTDSPYFKSFLKSLEDVQDKYIIVFRIPFVENETLDTISNNIGDVLYVRNVSFVPFTIEELHMCANKGLDKFGFRLDDSAWQVFDSKISEEKSDGRFYGINTVNKIVNEMIYKKHLVNAMKNENNTVISSDDIMSMSKTFGNCLKTGEDMMHDLVGMDAVKEQISEIVTQISHAVKNKDVSSPCIHMRFVGNPGTGKTTVARIIGKILCEKGVLRNGHFFEYSGRDFCGTYIGETAPKTAGICRDAYGSVLFIDEAYSLYTGDNGKDYGREALTTLIAEMENHRSDLVVIMAGYKDDMEILMHGNAGLASRMPFKIEFPNFSREELYNIFEHMVKSEFEYDDSIFEAAKTFFNSLDDEFISSKEFSNARYVRNIYERTWGKAAVREKLDKSGKIILTAEDFSSAVNDCGSVALTTKKKHQIGF